jgi:hypothetical protein
MPANRPAFPGYLRSREACCPIQPIAWVSGLDDFGVSTMAVTMGDSSAGTVACICSSVSMGAKGTVGSMTFDGTAAAARARNAAFSCSSVSGLGPKQPCSAEGGFA